MNHNHHLECQDIIKYLNDYLDEDLESQLCAKIEAHIASCRNCKIVVNTLKKTIQIYQSTGQEISLPKDVQERLHTRLGLDSNAKKD